MIFSDRYLNEVMAVGEFVLHVGRPNAGVGFPRRRLDDLRNRYHFLLTLPRCLLDVRDFDRVLYCRGGLVGLLVFVRGSQCDGFGVASS